MSDSADVFAMTNPALCAVVLASFVGGYERGAGEWPKLPILFLPVPIVLSERIARTFKGTNRSTGLLEWLAREPHVAPIVGQRIQLAQDLSRRALLFGTRYGLLKLEEDGVSISVARRVTRRLASREVASGTVLHRRIAARLGTWVGEVRSPATVFHSFGVMP